MRLVTARCRLVACLVGAGCNNAVPPTAPNAMLLETAFTPPTAGPAVTARLVGVGHEARGFVSYSVQNGIAHLDLSADFFVSGAPGPFVYANTTNNANTGRPLRVAPLRANTGAQSYVFHLPAGATYGWVLIWCDPYNVALAEAQLPTTP